MDTTVQSCFVRSSTGRQFLLSPVTSDESDFPCCVACAEEKQPRDTRFPPEP
jgi:hypothetical protein